MESVVRMKNEIDNDSIGSQNHYAFKMGKYYKRSSTVLEDIDWMILNYSTDYLFAISKYLIDWRDYQPLFTAGLINKVSLETSEIYQWINSEFKDIAFTDEEYKKLHYCGLCIENVIKKCFSSADGYIYYGTLAAATPYAEMKQKTDIENTTKQTWWLGEENKMNWPQYMSPATVSQCAPWNAQPRGVRVFLMIHMCEIDFVQISEKRYVHFAPTVRSVRLKRYKVDFSLRPSATGEKGCASRGIGGRGESPSP